MNEVLITAEKWASGDPQSRGWRHLGNVAVEKRSLGSHLTGDSVEGPDKRLPIPVMEERFSLDPPDSDPLVQQANDGFDPMRVGGQLYSNWSTGPSINQGGVFGEYPPTSPGQAVGVYVQVRELKEK